MAVHTFNETPLVCGTLTLPTPMGVGCNKYGVDPKKFSIENLTAAYSASLDKGVHFFNTAQYYNNGESESALGQLRAAAGGRGIICSKFNSLNSKPQELVSTLRETLKRCQVDKLDAFLLHFPKGDFTVLADQLQIAIKEGLVANIGVSNFTEPELRKFHSMMKDRGIPVVFNEIEFSLLRRDAEINGLLGACRELGVTALAWAPLASGRLTAKHADSLRNPQTLALARTLAEIAEARGKTPAQVAINWCVCKGALPIPGARTEAQAVENAGSVGWRLSADEVARLDALAVEKSGFYDDPEAIYAFMGWWPNRWIRPAVSGLLRAVLFVVRRFVPLQNKGA